MYTVRCATNRELIHTDGLLHHLFPFFFLLLLKTKSLAEKILRRRFAPSRFTIFSRPRDERLLDGKRGGSSFQKILREEEI